MASLVGKLNKSCSGKASQDRNREATETLTSEKKLTPLGSEKGKLENSRKVSHPGLAHCLKKQTKKKDLRIK